MEISKTAIAGSLESNDVLITLQPSESPGLSLELESIVGKQYGHRIEQVVLGVLSKNGVQQGYVHVQDRGALDIVIEARLVTAIRRAGEA